MDTLEEHLLKALECPICFQLMIPPITQCNNGHNICNTCKPKLHHCPTCRGDFVNIRNKFAEEFSGNVEHPCRFKESGCSKKLSLESKVSHEKKCRYGPHRCPLFIDKYIQCEWVGPSTELEKHIRNGHKDNYVEKQIAFGRGNVVSVNTQTSMRAVVFALGKIFLLINTKTKNNYSHMCFMFVGAREDNSNDNYKYTLTIKTTDGKQSVTATLPCPHYQEFLDGELPKEKVVIYHENFAKLCCDKQKDLPFDYKIFKE